MAEKAKPRIYAMSFAKVYPYYVQKAEKKGRKKSEVDKIICWLTGYSLKELASQLDKNVNCEDFILDAPQLNPLRLSIKGVVCGVRVEEVKEPVMKEIRYLDLLIDKLAKGKSMGKILQEE